MVPNLTGPSMSEPGLTYFTKKFLRLDDISGKLKWNSSKANQRTLSGKRTARAQKRMKDMRYNMIRWKQFRIYTTIFWIKGRDKQSTICEDGPVVITRVLESTSRVRLIGIPLLFKILISFVLCVFVFQSSNEVRDYKGKSKRLAVH